MNKENLKDIKDKINNFVESKNFTRAVYALGIIVVLFFVFQAGMVAGFKKASFNRDWGNNYEMNFGPRRINSPFMKDNLNSLSNAHGAIGKIIKIDLPNIIVLDKDQTEKNIIVSDDTSILEMNGKVTKDDLAVDKYVIVIGNPNKLGQIESKLIRIIPSPEEMGAPSAMEFDNGMMPGFNGGDR